jgi:hypothetical protein
MNGSYLLIILDKAQSIKEIARLKLNERFLEKINHKKQ